MPYLYNSDHAASPRINLPKPPAPAMARLEDQPITDRLLVMAIRAWVDAVRADLPPCAAARACFEMVGSAEVASLVHALMTAIGYGVSRPLHIGRAACPGLTGDESLILDAVALGRARGSVDPAMVLRPFLTVAACRPVGHLCVELGRELAGRGMGLDGRLGRIGGRKPTADGCAVGRLLGGVHDGSA